MRELLPDNIALTERLAALPSGVAHARPPSEREIGGDKALATWMSSFATYIAIVAEAHPERVRDMLAYMRLVVREAGKFSGTGWLTYDSIFRRNNEGQEQRWNYLDASLHQVYIAGWRDKVAAPCRHCHHTEVDCAMAAIRPKTMAPISDPTGLEGGLQRKTACPLFQATTHMHLVECRQLQIPRQVHLCTCLFSL